MAAVLDAFDADIAARPPTEIGAPERSRLRGVVRALLPLALDDPTFDVTVTAGPTVVAVRVHHPAGLGPVAGGFVAGAGRAEQPQAAESAPSAGGLGAGGVAAPRTRGTAMRVSASVRCSMGADVERGPAGGSTCSVRARWRLSSRRWCCSAR